MKAIVKSTQGNDSVIEFTFDDGTKSTQTIANVPLENEEVTTQFLKDYAEAYQRGKQVEEKQVAEGLIGKTLTI